MVVPALMALALAASDAEMMRARQLLDAHDCDGLASMFRQVEPRSATQDLATARFLVLAATECRKQDKLLALDFSQKASRLAPGDEAIATAEAESFIALDQRGEAARLLDDTIRAHPQEALHARLLRGQLADAEHDWVAAVQVLAPITEDPQLGAEAKAILLRARAGLQEDAQLKSALKDTEAQVAANAAQAAQIASAPGPVPGASPSGTEVWSGRGTVETGGTKTFRTENLQAGRDYVLHVLATCTGPKTASASRGRRRHRGTAPRAETFGLNFKAFIGRLDPIPLDADVAPTVNDRPFRALEDNPPIRIEDLTDAKVNVKCTLRDVSVRTP